MGMAYGFVVVWVLSDFSQHQGSTTYSSRKGAMFLYDEGAPSNHGFTPKHPRFISNSSIYISPATQKFHIIFVRPCHDMRMLNGLIYPFACSFHSHTNPKGGTVTARQA